MPKDEHGLPDKTSPLSMSNHVNKHHSLIVKPLVRINFGVTTVMLKTVKNLLLIGTLFFLTNNSFSLSSLDIVCPTVEQLQRFQMKYTSVDGFDPSSQTVNFTSLLDENDDFIDQWHLIVDGISAGKGVSLEAVSGETIAKLVLFSEDPFQFEHWSWTVKTIPVCIYTLPGNPSVNAMALFYNSSSNSSLKQGLTSEHHRQTT